MDNTRDLPGYKHYLDSGGARPALHVAFLDIRGAPGRWVNGLLFSVDDDELPRLDARERNYRRIDVGGRVSGAVGGPVWTYVGLPAARARQREALRRGRLVVSRDYHDRVRAGFADLGDRELEDFRACTAALPCPLVDLNVVHHPPSPSPSPSPSPIAAPAAG